MDFRKFIGSEFWRFILPPLSSGPMIFTRNTIFAKCYFSERESKLGDEEGIEG